MLPETRADALADTPDPQSPTMSASGFNTDVTPLGERALRVVLENVIARGDEAESNYLEVKRPLEMASKGTIAKIAKFLLGAANRRPEEAARHFHGYCVLVIGAQKGSAPGVPRGTEAHEVEDRLRPYLGPDFPGFEFTRVPVEGDNEVLFVIALPPEDGQPMFPCHKTYQSDDKRDALENGAIYVRGLSNTRPARSEEILRLIARGQATGKAPIDLVVGVTGEIHVVQNVREVLVSARELRLKEFEKAQQDERSKPTRSFTFETLLANGPFKRLTDEDREQSLAEWHAKEAVQLENGRRHLLGVGLDGAGIQVVSRGRFVSKPHLTITFSNCEVIDWQDLNEADLHELAEPVIDPPTPMGFSVVPPITNFRPASYPVEWQNCGEDAKVILTPDSFRPDVPWTSDQDDFVLVSRDDTATAVSASWALTEEGNDKVVTGEFTIPTAAPVHAAAIVKALGASGRNK